MKTQKGFIPILLILLGLVVIGGGAYLYTKNSSKEIVVPEVKKENSLPIVKETKLITKEIVKDETSNNEVVGQCGFVISSHKPNDLVEWPIIINGKVSQDRTGYNCFWQTFEGVSGSAQLYVYEDNTWRPIGNSLNFGPEFSLNFDFAEAGLKINNPIKIIFTEENPSAQRPSLTFELPLVLK